MDSYNWSDVTHPDFIQWFFNYCWWILLNWPHNWGFLGVKNLVKNLVFSLCLDIDSYNICLNECKPQIWYRWVQFKLHLFLWRSGNTQRWEKMWKFFEKWINCQFRDEYGQKCYIASFLCLFTVIVEQNLFHTIPYPPIIISGEFHPGIWFFFCQNIPKNHFWWFSCCQR